MATYGDVPESQIPPYEKPEPDPGPIDPNPNTPVVEPPVDKTAPPPAPSAGSGGMPPYSGDLAAWVKLILGTKGAYYYGDNPDYWTQRIGETGGPTPENLTYWWNRMMTNAGGGAGTPGAGLSGPAVDPSVWTTPFTETFTPPTWAPLPSVPVAPTVDVPQMDQVTLPPAPQTPSYTLPQAPTFYDPSSTSVDRSGTPQYPAESAAGQATSGSPSNAVALPPTPTAPSVTLPPPPTPPTIHLPEAPQFSFAAPSGEDLFQDPSFLFRTQQGREALERSAAARGTLNSGGTLQNILDYGQNAATQEYGNVWNRRFTEAQAAFAPKLEAYRTQAGAAVQDAANAEAAQRAVYAAQAQAAGQDASMQQEVGLAGYRTQADAIIQAAQAQYQAQVQRIQQEAQFAQENGQLDYKTKADAALQLARDKFNAQVAGAQQNASAQQQTNMTGYTTQAGNVQQQNQLALQNAWQQYLQRYEASRNFANDTWDRTYQATTA